VIYFHGAAGTVGSGHRPQNYRALSAGAPQSVHVLSFDYRGFGCSEGILSEEGILEDAIHVVEWVINELGIPPGRIILFGQSLGTAVVMGVIYHFSSQATALTFAGTIMVAPFVDVPALMAIYRLAGVIPLLGPLMRFPRLFTILETLVQDQWRSIYRLEHYIDVCESKGLNYRLTMIHAEDDYDIPWQHTRNLSSHAVNITHNNQKDFCPIDRSEEICHTTLGEGGSVQELRTRYGVVREEILKYGLHDVIMGYPVITMAVMRMTKCD
jgi:abhydrolase domain-containing protein 12